MIVHNFIVSVVQARQEMDEGLSELAITEWMAALLAAEAGSRVYSIDGVKLRVVGNSGSIGIDRLIEHKKGNPCDS